MLYKVVVASDARALEIIEFDRPRITRKEFKVIMESLLFNTLHYSNGFAVACVLCNNTLLFDVNARLFGHNTIDIRMTRWSSDYRSMQYRYMNIK